MSLKRPAFLSAHTQKNRQIIGAIFLLINSDLLLMFLGISTDF